VEAEYYAVLEMSIEVNQVIYLRNLLDDIGFPQEWDTRRSYACVLGQHRVHRMGEPRHWRTALRAKHIDIRKPFAHEATQNCHMLVRVDTTDQLADIFIKASDSPPAQFVACVPDILHVRART
jgi:hypothetical protein